MSISPEELDRLEAVFATVGESPQSSPVEKAEKCGNRARIIWSCVVDLFESGRDGVGLLTDWK